MTTPRAEGGSISGRAGNDAEVRPVSPGECAGPVPVVRETSAACQVPAIAGAVLIDGVPRQGGRQARLSVCTAGGGGRTSATNGFGARGDHRFRIDPDDVDRLSPFGAAAPSDFSRGWFAIASRPAGDAA